MSARAQYTGEVVPETPESAARHRNAEAAASEGGGGAMMWRRKAGQEYGSQATPEPEGNIEWNLYSLSITKIQRGEESAEETIALYIAKLPPC